MKIKFGLNIILHVEVIDTEVNYTQDLFMNVNNLVPELSTGSHEVNQHVKIFADYQGERIYFKNFNEIALMDKRRLLALQNIKVILS